MADLAAHADLRALHQEELVRGSCLELADHLRDAARNARPFIVDYAEYLSSPKRNNPPTAHGMHPLIAKLIREIMRDLEVERRRSA